MWRKFVAKKFVRWNQSKKLFLPRRLLQFSAKKSKFNNIFVVFTCICVAFHFFGWIFYFILNENNKILKIFSFLSNKIELFCKILIYDFIKNQLLFFKFIISLFLRIGQSGFLWVFAYQVLLLLSFISKLIKNPIKGENVAIQK